PSDIGFSDEGYILPALNMQSITVAVDQTTQRDEGELFRNPTLSATNIHKEMRLTCSSRVSELVRIVNEKPDEAWVIWC
ncbi:hypothetical protein, partial [Streptococcus pneumoniae]|uniref:hypothetical protein n=1 Tax=Streptococcus pneumoniae TaxID=1313 RepID=UPI001E521462